MIGILFLETSSLHGRSDKWQTYNLKMFCKKCPCYRCRCGLFVYVLKPWWKPPRDGAPLSCIVAKMLPAVDVHPNHHRSRLSPWFKTLFLESSPLLQQLWFKCCCNGVDGELPMQYTGFWFMVAMSINSCRCLGNKAEQGNAISGSFSAWFEELHKWPTSIIRAFTFTEGSYITGLIYWCNLTCSFQTSLSLSPPLHKSREIKCSKNQVAQDHAVIKPHLSKHPQ